MKLPILFLACGLALFNPLNGMTAASRLALLRTGDEVVFDFHQSITVVGVADAGQNSVTLRIVTATKDVLSREDHSSWLRWYQEGAPGALSNETLVLATDHLEVIDSRDRQKSAWLLTLLGLELTKIPDTQRRRAGPAPASGEIDLRPPFTPKIIVDSQPVEAKSMAFSATWPDDGSDLASMPLILYFPQSHKAVQAFPYWIESPQSSYHVAVIDSHSHWTQ